MVKKSVLLIMAVSLISMSGCQMDGYQISSSDVIRVWRVNTSTGEVCMFTNTSDGLEKKCKN